MLPLFEGLGTMESLGGSANMAGASDLLTKSGAFQDLMKDPGFIKYMMQQAGVQQPPILTKGWKTRQSF